MRRITDPASCFPCRVRRSHLFTENSVGAAPGVASNVTEARFRSSQKLAVDAPDAKTRVGIETQVLASRQEGIPGGILREGGSATRLLLADV